jgi:hypothetical protein
VLKVVGYEISAPVAIAIRRALFYLQFLKFS